MRGRTIFGSHGPSVGSQPGPIKTKSAENSNEKKKKTARAATDRRWQVTTARLYLHPEPPHQPDAGQGQNARE